MPSRSPWSLPRTALLFAWAVLVVACDDDAPSGAATGAPTGTSATAVSTTTAMIGSGGAAPAQSDAGTAPAPAVDAGPATVADAGARDAASDAAGPRDAGAKVDAGAAPRPDAGAAPPPADAGASATPSVPAPAPGSANAVALQIDQVFAPKKTFSARFKQEFTAKVSGAVKRSSGTVLVDKPNRISFRYDPPNKNRIVSDGTEIKVYIAEDNVMFVQPVAGNQYPGAMAFIMGNGLLPSFDFSFNEAAKAWTAGPVLHGKPRQPTPHYESVFFYVDNGMLAKQDPGVIQRVLILDAQKNKNRFDFEGATQPASIDPAEFVFTPPPGTDIKR